MKKQHLYEVDLMRACIILGVICVHVLSSYDAKTVPFSTANIGMDLLTMTFHFTREAFMFITGLVLFYTYADREFSSTSFWKKRFALIAIPYIAWTALYILFTGTYLQGFDWTATHLWSTFVQSLLTANQFFLYFLMVSMQLYLVFPLMLKLLKRLKRVHPWVFAGSFVLELLIMGFNQWVMPHVDLTQLPTWLAVLLHYRDRFILTYQFWFVAGAIFAMNYQTVRDFVTSRGRMVASVLIVGLLALYGTYFAERFGLHFADGAAVDVLQPIMIPYSLIAAATLWTIGTAWSRVRTEERMRRFSGIVRFFGGVSFGIFLLHPIALHYVESIANQLNVSRGVHFAFIPVIIAVTYVAAGFAAYAIGKIPMVSYIVGEKTRLARPAKRELRNARQAS
ncbi:acyltransferase [Alicyclobacillus dauci]|uniref:Acyltransferase n=1 Tax=Alicyclobacillus dauci TaxID=1475485 RepID=A0ABY6Z8A9_9BACL|nr:acyltransferase [Alicyclobacillus dauci]WAH39121.1 acyltransferase [Alicyclobacillus dauci]